MNIQGKRKVKYITYLKYYTKRISYILQKVCKKVQFTLFQKHMFYVHVAYCSSNILEVLNKEMSSYLILVNPTTKVAPQMTTKAPIKTGRLP